MKTTAKTTTIKELQKQLTQLRSDLKEHLQNLRSGSSSDVRKPTRIKREIARNLTQQRQLSLQTRGGDDV